MSWHFSRALMEDYANSRSLPGLVEEYSEGNYSDGEQFAQLSCSHTLLGYCASDKTIKFFTRSPCGMIFEPLTENHGKELLTLFLEDFRARTSVQQVEELV